MSEPDHPEIYRSQAEQYARALPAAEGRPPFGVVDVGNRIELYAAQLIATLVAGGRARGARIAPRMARGQAGRRAARALVRGAARHRQRPARAERCL